MKAKKGHKRTVRRSDSLHLSVHGERHDPPDASKIARVLIDLAQTPENEPEAADKATRLSTEGPSKITPSNENQAH